MKQDTFTFNGNSEIAKGNDIVRLLFYANIGFFIEVVQMLEFNIRKLLCYEQSVKEIEAGNIEKERIIEICAKFEKYYSDTYKDKLMLGKLINRLEKECCLLEDFIKLIKEINNFRARIVHSIFQNNVISGNLGNEKVVNEYINKRLIPMTNNAIMINKTIIKIIEEYRNDLHEYKRNVGLI